MVSQVSMGELQEFADEEGIEYEETVSYEEMRELVEIHECKQCGDEYVRGWNVDVDFCSDTCEVLYRK